MHQQELNQEFLLFSIKLSVKPVSPNITPTALFEYLGVLCFSSVFPLSWEIWTAFEYIMIQFNAAYSHDCSLFWETVSFGLSKWLQRVYCNIFWIILLCCSKLSANQQREHWETRSFHRTIPCNEHIKTTPNMVWARTSSTCLVWVRGTPPGSTSPLKKSLLDTLLVSWSFT